MKSSLLTRFITQYILKMRQMRHGMRIARVSHFVEAPSQLAVGNNYPERMAAFVNKFERFFQILHGHNFN